MGEHASEPWASGTIVPYSLDWELGCRLTGSTAGSQNHRGIEHRGSAASRASLAWLSPRRGARCLSLQVSAEESRTGVSPASLQAPVTGLSWGSHCLPVQRTPSVHSQPFLPHPQPTTLGDETAREPREATGLLPAPHDHGPAARQIPL